MVRLIVAIRISARAMQLAIWVSLSDFMSVFVGCYWVGLSCDSTNQSEDRVRHKVFFSTIFLPAPVPPRSQGLRVPAGQGDLLARDPGRRGVDLSPDG
jgi:hypothetical protein